MSIINANNSDVRVFPDSDRDPSLDLQASLLSEQNITKLLRNSSIMDSYVIGGNFSFDNPWIEFVIHGYYFRIVGGSTANRNFLGKWDLWACIGTTEDDDGNESLINTGSPSEIYNALQFGDEPTMTASQFFTGSSSGGVKNKYLLHLKQNGVICPESKKTSINFSKIDCGTI